MARPEPRFTYIFATELQGRLLWFGRLRWLAVAGLASASLLGRGIGLPAAWPSLLVVAGFVALYNLLFQQRLRASQEIGEPYAHLRAFAIGQMVMDLVALMVTVHFTGGLQSPLLAFFAFHMAIGTIMIATRIMYLLAGATALGMLALYLVESQGFLGTRGLLSGDLALAAGGRNLLSLIVAMFGIVYLTDSVTSRFKQRNIELYRMTSDLQYLLGETERLEESKSHYMRISAHQLRSPLATVKTSLEVLTQGFVQPSSERGQSLLVGSVDRVDSLLAIVNDLLDLAKIREGHKTRAPWSQQIDINQVVTDVLETLRPYANERQVELVSDFRSSAVLPWAVQSDLVHAFENLIHNGIKYSDPGQTVTLRVETTDTCILVEVADRGIGIPPEFHDRVFLEFVRTPAAKRHAEGTGLGLSIVREAVNEHRGRVDVVSQVGEGSTFTVSLPLPHTPPTSALPS